MTLICVRLQGQAVNRLSINLRSLDINIFLYGKPFVKNMRSSF